MNAPHYCISFSAFRHSASAYKKSHSSRSSFVSEFLLRSLPDSNWSKRFCRPVPNLSAKRPPSFAFAKVQLLIQLPKFFSLFSFFRLHALQSQMHRFFIKASPYPIAYPHFRLYFQAEQIAVFKVPTGCLGKSKQAFGKILCRHCPERAELWFIKKRETD